MVMSRLNSRKPDPTPGVAAVRLAAAAALFLVAAQARAQPIDYGRLGQLFGEPITTSATGSPQRASEVPANMEIITQEDIRRSGADNIADVLQYVAGIDVRRYTLGQEEVAVRGYDQQYSPRLLVLINGRQVYIDNYGYTDWRSLPVQLAEIRQIEVVKGPNSALFGFNAAGGVVNIITYDPLLDPVDEAAASGGANGYHSLSAVATLRTADRAGLRLSGGEWGGTEFPTAGLPRALGPYETSPHQSTASADGRVRLVPGVEITGEVTGSDGTGIEALPSPALLTVHLRTDSGKLGLEADTRAGLMTLTAYRNATRYELSSDAAEFSLRDALEVVQASDLFRVRAAHTLRLGLEYRNEAVGGLGPHEVGDRILAASLAWNWRISRRLRLSNAVRVDRLAMSFKDSILPGRGVNAATDDKGGVTAVSFNSGLVYTPTPLDTVRLLVARGAQAPSITELGLQSQQTVVGGPTVTYAGNPDLRPAIATNYEADYDRSLPALRSVLRTAVYYEDIHELLASAINTPLTLTPQGVIAFSGNVGSSRAVGGEVSLQGHAAAGLRWSASYARISITQHLRIAPLTGSSSLLDYAHGTPTDAVDAGLGYAAHGIEADVAGRWQSGFTDYGLNAAAVVSPVPVGSYLTLSARVGYRLTQRVSVAVSGQQLTRNRLVEAAGLPVERRVYGTISVSF